MNVRLIRPAVLLCACLALSLAGCANVNVWPFGGAKAPELSRTPGNATDYECNGGKRFYVRYLDQGKAAWVIYPEREFRLDKVASETGARYSNGVAMLETDGSEATLRDGPLIAFTGCKAKGSSAR